MEGLTLPNLEREILTAVTLGDLGEGGPGRRHRRRRRQQGIGLQDEEEEGDIGIVYFLTFFYNLFIIDKFFNKILKKEQGNFSL